jgi:hypothetical protein
MLTLSLTGQLMKGNRNTCGHRDSSRLQSLGIPRRYSYPSGDHINVTPSEFKQFGPTHPRVNRKDDDQHKVFPLWVIASSYQSLFLILAHHALPAYFVRLPYQRGCCAVKWIYRDPSLIHAVSEDCAQLFHFPVDTGLGTFLAFSACGSLQPHQAVMLKLRWSDVTYWSVPEVIYQEIYPHLYGFPISHPRDNLIVPKLCWKHFQGHIAVRCFGEGHSYR